MARDQLADHYSKRHPGISYGGMEQYREGGGCCSGSCLMMLMGLFSLAIPAWYLVH
ncbi:MULTISPECIES: hypothetical protein [Kitasatospora]|uniref:hypothetical protein n=1 Tax=Kitasatospora TaxID=2063 RepID=UPI002474F669|nr:hypothetical protein [Kitasatospora sp. GP30]